MHLATIRVYHGSKSATGKSPRILLTLPPDPNHPVTGEFAGDVYEMDMVQESVENQVVIAEREKEPVAGYALNTVPTVFVTPMAISSWLGFIL